MSVKPFNFFAVDSRSPGLMAVVKKELSDHFTSFRFYILFFLIGIASISAVYVAALTIRKAVSAAPDINFVFMWLFTTSGRELPPFINFVGFLAPLIGIALGFDAINSERLRGSLSFVLAQPLHRDALINGKFLAGLLTITLMLTALFTFVGGLGLLMTGVPPVTEEVLRILFFLLLSILYVAFWL
ncbi:MAG: ABC transporter permease, partial [Dethiobacteria bacterium]